MTDNKNSLSLKKKSTEVSTCDFSPCGNFFAIGGKDGKICISKILKKGEKLFLKFIGHSGGVTSLRFSNDGNYLVTGGNDRMVKVWEIRRNYKSAKLYRTFKAHETGLKKISISGDSRIIASICDKSLRIWDINEGNEIMMLGLKNSRALDFHPNDTKLTVSGFGGSIWMVDFRDRGVVEVIETGENCVNDLVFGPEGEYIVVGFKYFNERDNPVIKVIF